MSPLVSHDAAVLAFLGLLLAIPALGIADALIRALRRSAARRRSVLGWRGPPPEWRARRNVEGRWIVERRRG